LVLPTTPILAPPLHWRDAELGGGWRSPRAALLGFDAPWSVLGVPAMSVPVPGRGAGQLPIGVQLVGRPGGDEELLAVAAGIASMMGTLVVDGIS
jgi:Asp-tRNA(Asn)/Glu-tRNA(Gln) amidotransferase A subunit family amidase